MIHIQRSWCCNALAGALPFFLLACAVPATEVAVSTMPMKQALEISRSDSSQAVAPRPGIAPLERRSLPPAIPGTVLSTPDIRLAYLYEWVDAEGNRHYGEWVAIPVASSHWVMSDGSQAPIELTAPDTAPAAEGP